MGERFLAEKSHFYVAELVSSVEVAIFRLVAVAVHFTFEYGSKKCF